MTDDGFMDLYVIKLLLNNCFCRWKHYFETEKCLDILNQQRSWKSTHTYNKSPHVLILSQYALSLSNIHSSPALKAMVFTATSEQNSMMYTHINHVYHSMPETLEHRMIRSRMRGQAPNIPEGAEHKPNVEAGDLAPLLDEFPYLEKSSRTVECRRTDMPRFLLNLTPKVFIPFVGELITHPVSYLFTNNFGNFFQVKCKSTVLYSNSRKAQWDWQKYLQVHSWQGLQHIWNMSSIVDEFRIKVQNYLQHVPKKGGIEAAVPLKSWSNIIVPGTSYFILLFMHEQ